MRKLENSYLARAISSVLALSLAMPAYALPKKKIVPVIPRTDPRTKLIQKPNLNVVDPNGLQPNAGLNPQVTGVITKELTANSLVSGANLFKKNSGAKSTGSPSGNSFSYNQGGASSGGPPAGGSSDEENGGGGGGVGRAREGKGSQNGGAEAFPQWYPMCLFIGEHVPGPAGNDAVKGLIQQAATCKVNLVVFPVTTKGIPNSEGLVNAAQTASCNITEALGVPNASTSTCAPDTDIAGEMCKVPKNDDKGNFIRWDPAVKGCAVLAKGSKDRIKEELKKLYDPFKEQAEFEARWKEIDKDLGAGDGGSGVIPSIEEKDSCSASIVGHEALGHSMWGHPNGKTDGNGIGVSKKDDPGGEAGDGKGWSAAGCEAMRSKAYTNDGRWKYDPKRENYYTRIADPARQWDLMGGKKLFRPPNGPPPGGKSVATRQTPQGPQSISYDEGSSKSSAAAPAGGGGSSASPATAPPPKAALDLAIADPSVHKRKQPFIETLLSNLEGKTPAVENEPPPASYPIPAAPPAGGGKSNSSRIEYDESASKAKPGGAGDGFQQATAGPAPNLGAGSKTSLTYDEGAPKGATSISLGGGSGAGKTTLSYDESAPKGGASGAGLSNVAGGSSALGDPGASIKLNANGAAIGSGLSADFFKDSNGGGGDSNLTEEEKKRNEARRRGGSRAESTPTRRRAPASVEEGATP